MVLFGRNGAGKTTTIKCLLNLLRPTSGDVRLFGLDPARQEVAVESRLAYVPGHVAFYPWMTVREKLDYFASFRARWNLNTERELVDQFRLDVTRKASQLSKGQRTQVALVAAVAAEPELLVLDEPTSGLDPIVRREFIQAVIRRLSGGGPRPSNGVRLDALARDEASGARASATLYLYGVNQRPPSPNAISVTARLVPVMAASYAVLALWLGMRNHRSVERAGVRAWPQALWIFSYLAVCLAVEWVVLTYF